MRRKGRKEEEDENGSRRRKRRRRNGEKTVTRTRLILDLRGVLKKSASV